MSNEFDFDTKNGWTHYADAASQEQMDVLAARYMDFLSHAKTERETVDLVVEALKAAGFSEDFKKDLVFRTYRGKAVFVARKGKKPLASGVRLISAHTDAPRLDFKQRPLQEQVGIGQAKTHYYGGIRKYQWAGPASRPARRDHQRGRHVHQGRAGRGPRRSGVHHR